MSRICRHCGRCRHDILLQASSRRGTFMLYLLTIMSATAAFVSAGSGDELSSDAWREDASRESLRASVLRIRTASAVPVEDERLAPRSAPPGYPEVDLFNCMQESHPRVAATIDDFNSARPARLTPELALFSRAPRGLDVTVVTAFSTSRLYMLAGMCGSWRGPLSAAVYQGLVAGHRHMAFNRVQKAKAAIQELFDRMEARDGCQLDIVLYSEVMESKGLIQVLYPVNALRNAALLMARTELIFILDGDMVISADLSEALADPERFEEVKKRCNDKKFMVIPAFDTENSTLAYSAAAGGKSNAMDAFQSGNIFPFLKGHYDPAHAPTNFTRWYTASSLYDITYTDEFEPWGLVSRRLTPFFDVRFRGYGKNKIQYLRLLHSTGFGYEVNADSFIVHRPHPKTKARRNFSANLVAWRKERERPSKVHEQRKRSSRGSRRSRPARTEVPGSTEGEDTNRRRKLRWQHVSGDDTDNGHSEAGIMALSSSAMRRLAEAAPVELFNVTNNFYEEFVLELRRGTYEILVTEGFARCKQQLPWWQDYQNDGVVPTRAVHPRGTA